MKTIFGILTFFGALVFAGCAQIDLSSPGSLAKVEVLGATTRCDRQIVIRNTGFYAFGYTLISGDLEWDEKKHDIKGGPKFFTDMSRIEWCYDALQHIAKRENRDLVDVVFTENSAFGFAASTSDAITMAAGAMGAIFGLYEVQASAILREKSIAPISEEAH